MKQTHVWTLKALRYPVYLMARNQYFFTGLLEQVYLCTICLLASNVITARKRSLGQGYIFTGICHSVNRGVCLSACWDTPPCQGHPPAKETPPCQEPSSLQGDPPPGHTQGGNLRGSGSGPQPRGKFRGIRSRPTPKGEIQGDQIQAHTQGGNSGGSGPDPPPPRRLLLRAVCILLECILVNSEFVKYIIKSKLLPPPPPTKQTFILILM